MSLPNLPNFHPETFELPPKHEAGASNSYTRTNPVVGLRIPGNHCLSGNVWRVCLDLTVSVVSSRIVNRGAIVIYVFDDLLISRGFTARNHEQTLTQIPANLHPNLL